MMRLAHQFIRVLSGLRTKSSASLSVYLPQEILETIAILDVSVYSTMLLTSKTMRSKLQRYRDMMKEQCRVHGQRLLYRYENQLHGLEISYLYGTIQVRRYRLGAVVDEVLYDSKFQAVEYSGFGDDRSVKVSARWRLDFWYWYRCEIHGKLIFGIHGFEFNQDIFHTQYLEECQVLRHAAENLLQRAGFKVPA